MQQQADIGKRLDELRFQRKGLPIGGERLFIASQRLQRQRLIGISLGAIRVGFDGAAIGGERGVEMFPGMQHIAQPRMNERQRRIEPERFFIGRNGFGELVLAVKDQPFHAVALSKRGRQPDRGFAGGLRLFQPVERDKGVGAARMGGGEAWQQRDGLRIGAFGGGMVALALLQVAEIAMRLGEGSDRARSPSGRLRLPLRPARAA